MAIANSYPMGTPKSGDLLLGTSVPLTPEGKATTRNFSISEVVTLATKNYVEVTKAISNAEWLALATTSVQIVPSPGIGKFTQVLLAYVKWTHAGASFIFSQPLNLSNGTSGASNNLTTQGVLPQAYEDIDGDTTQIFTISGSDTSANAAINFGCPSATTLSGGGSLAITIRYQVI
tara:strand:- start:44 stop:571 length:528 start_codon:yes stop_codon:yes gene_type:complete